MMTMSDPLGGVISGVFALDASTGTVTLSLWAAGALAALLVAVCAIALSRASRDGIAGSFGLVALVVASAALAWFFLQGRQDAATERHALEARAGVLATRATMPGSPLACLDAMAGDAVEGSCERTLFASPEAMASAVSYVAAQLSLFVDVSRFVNRGHPEFEPLLASLRRAVERDRYGLVAHVLATRDGCTSDQCPALALMSDAQRVSDNLTQRTYDFYVVRHSAVWPAPAQGPVANAAPATGAPPGSLPNSLPNSLPGVSGRQAMPSGTSAAALPGSPRPSGAGPELFFPNAESIPPVNIMTAEPSGGQPETTGSAPSRPPARRAAPKEQSKQQAPIDLNAAARGAPSATAQ
jgi:hypothetical protein